MPAPAENVETLYQFIDKTRICFEKFANIKDDTKYHKMVGALLKTSNNGDHPFTVGDMFCFRDELTQAGFKWGIDFFIRKVQG